MLLGLFLVAGSRGSSLVVVLPFLTVVASLVEFLGSRAGKLQLLPCTGRCPVVAPRIFPDQGLNPGLCVGLGDSLHM